MALHYADLLFICNSRAVSIRYSRKQDPIRNFELHSKPLNGVRRKIH